jgi:hypothetical protein
MRILRATIAAVTSRNPRLRAATDYGSAARREDRPLSDQHPSGVDLLLLFERPSDQEVDVTYAPRLAIFDSMGPALDRCLHVPRESQVMLATDDLRDRDETLIKNVAREGLLLWARGQLSGLPSNVWRIAPAESAAQW